LDCSARHTSNLRPFFAHAKEITEKRPNTFTDGAPNFHDAFNKAFTLNDPRTHHISHVRLQGDHCQLFHNYHEVLKGKTPAEVCGIDIGGENNG